jgi:diguanylate cyclase (GGDEF)-like protein
VWLVRVLARRRGEQEEEEGPTMHRVRELMTQRVLYVTPHSTVQAAMDLLRIQQLEVLPVVDDGSLLGVLDSLSLYRFHGELPVREVMSEPLTVEADAPLGEAASLMLHHRMHQVPVVEAGRLVGLLSHRELLATWGASTDVLTGLPWHDFMRSWASGHLTAGREIAMIFIDLNDFGQFNKVHGHGIGNAALKAVATAVRHQIDPRRDVLCRYGGDEFAIATTRTQEEAWGLAHRLHDAVGKAEFGDECLRVGVSIGIAGGKRHLPRPGSHPSANVDDLINWASRASTRAKVEPAHVAAFKGSGSDGPQFGALPALPEGRGEFATIVASSPRIVVEDYAITHAGPGIEVTVHLRCDDETRSGFAAHAGGELLQAVAAATTACLQEFLNPEVRLTASEIQVAVPGEVPGIVTAWVRLHLPDQEEWLVGAVPLQEDRYRSVINAVLDATNRRMGWLAQFRTSDPRPEADEVGIATAP